MIDNSVPVGLVQNDPGLAPFADALRHRMGRYRDALAALQDTGGLLGAISQGHQYFGFNRGEENGRLGLWYREWAPGARSLALVGAFNGWDAAADILTRDDWGVWRRFFADADYAGRLVHGSLLKVHVHGADDSRRDRIPAYIRRVVQDDVTKDFTAQLWMPETSYRFTNASPSIPHGEGLRIYEAHVGMAQDAERVGTYDEFTDNILPRIVALGYNAVQLMAIQEHPYYGSFGYHVSSLFAPSSRFGTPEELKRLIDTAHGLGLRVLLDIVHSHAARNQNEGLNRFDGTEYQYFHAGERGDHPLWDSKLFDYSRYEVRRLLLSNVRYWLEEFRFDGFRFDGVTSMLYLNHGVQDFSSYDDYFNPNVDEDAVLHLQLSNDVAHALLAGAVTISEDVSGMPGMARPCGEGGLGFDYRLAMGVPDLWIKIVKERRDEEWPLDDIYGALLNRRWNEKHIGYAESHDQALVGDQTLSFRLIGEEMYWNMTYFRESVVVDRGIALLKLIRLITFALAGEGYLNFMGNEFGHPEWVDFPREGNGWGYKHARRQWSLVDDPNLRYGALNRFDKAMLALDHLFHLLPDRLVERLALHEDTRQLVFRHGPLVFAFNFHATESYADLRIPVPDHADYHLILNTDDSTFSGHGRGLASGTGSYPIQDVPMYGRDQSVQIYLPSRSAQVLAPIA